MDFITALLITLIITLISMVIIGIITRAYKPIISFFYNLTHKKNELLIGEWHVYHRTYKEGETILRQEEWCIKPHYLSGYHVNAVDTEDSKLKFNGHLICGDKDAKGHLCGEMRGVGFHEIYHVRMNNLLAGRKSFYAIILGIDINDDIVATIYVFSRDELGVEEAEELLDNQKDDCRTQLRLLNSRQKQAKKRVGNSKS